jgi:polysaccharide deacetylase family protein (PEP-CTERM system associated)
MEPGIFTVDVEDGVNLGMRDLMGVDIPPTKRVETNTRIILELLSEFNVKGTFFVLGQVAEHYPGLVKDISDAGHEIGVHGYDHYRFYRMDYDFAKDQLDRARKLLQDMTGQSVKGHRAPAFSINQQTLWALDLLAELGFEYDSSIKPFAGLQNGWSSFEKSIIKIRLKDGREIFEVPVSGTRFLGMEIPSIGGSYFRLMPVLLSDLSFKMISKNRNPILYLHPYELDENRYPDYFFEALKDKPLKAKIRVQFMRLNRKKVKSKLAHLLGKFPFTDIRSVLKKEGAVLKSVSMKKLSHH